jgi:hypothetical protein
MKRFINFLIIMHYWSVVAKSRKIIDDPKSKHSTLLIENLTLEELLINYGYNPTGFSKTPMAKTF